MDNSGEKAFSEDDSEFRLKEPFQSIDVAAIALDSASIGIWIIDPASRKLFSSKRTKELFGFLPGEEMSFEDAMSKVIDKHRKVVMDAIENAFKKQDQLYIEYPVSVLTDNRQRWLSVKGGFNSSGSGTHNNYFSGIVMDITEQKENDLRRSKFIGMVSHELKTPLTALKAYVQMLNNWAKKQKDNFTIGALSKVEKQVKKMLNMINSLLHLSGAEVGKIHLNKTEFILNELMTEVVEETLFITSAHNIIMAPCEIVKVTADREKIEQVLVNLLSNAAKYSGKDLPIEIGCVIQGKNIEVSIRDQGLGIAKKDITKLFLPHYRVQSKETEKIAGFGIGLYLCSEIVNRHHGKIWVESELGKGSNFKFTLPLG